MVRCSQGYPYGCPASLKIVGRTRRGHALCVRLPFAALDAQHSSMCRVTIKSQKLLQNAKHPFRMSDGNTLNTASGDSD